MSEDSTPYKFDVAQRPLGAPRPLPLEDQQVLARYPNRYVARAALVGGAGAAVLSVFGPEASVQTFAGMLAAGGFVGGVFGFVAMIAVGEFRYSAWVNRQRGR